MGYRNKFEQSVKIFGSTDFKNDVNEWERLKENFKNIFN